MGLCAFFVVSWWRNKGLHTLNRMHNEQGAVQNFCPPFVILGSAIETVEERILEIVDIL